MTKVVGPERKGRVRGIGMGSSRLMSTSSGGACHDDDHDLCNERLEFLESKYDKLQKELAELRAKLGGSNADEATPSSSIGPRSRNWGILLLAMVEYAVNESCFLKVLLKRVNIASRGRCCE